MLYLDFNVCEQTSSKSPLEHVWQSMPKRTVLSTFARRFFFIVALNHEQVWYQQQYGTRGRVPTVNPGTMDSRDATDREEDKTKDDIIIRFDGRQSDQWQFVDTFDTFGSLLGTVRLRLSEARG